MSLTHTEVTASAAELDPCGQPDHADCGIRDVLDRVGDKWSVLVIVELVNGARRFRQLQRAVDGISQRMLTLTVRRLERDGLVLRTVYPTVPAQVDYQLTDTGASLTYLVKPRSTDDSVVKCAWETENALTGWENWSSSGNNSDQHEGHLVDGATRSRMCKWLVELEVGGDVDDVARVSVRWPVPALTCVAGNGGVRSSGKKPKRPRSIRGP